MEVYYKAEIVTYCVTIENCFSAPAFLAELLVFLVFSAGAGIGWFNVVDRFAVLLCHRNLMKCRK